MFVKACDFIELELIKWNLNNYSASFLMWDEKNNFQTKFFGDTKNNFHLASLSKPIFSTFLLYMHQIGRINLGNILFNEANYFDFLSHVSGLVEDRDLVFKYKPGLRRVYTNKAYDLIYENLERELSINLKSEMKYYFNQILNIKSIQFGDSAAKDFEIRIEDFALFIKKLLSHQIIHKDNLKLATESYYKNIRGIVPGFGMFKDNSWGVGFEVKGIKNNHWMGNLTNPKSYGHFGQSGCFFMIDPTSRYAIIFFSDKQFSEWAKEKWGIFNDELFSLMH